MIGADAELRAMVEQERVNALVAHDIYELRTMRGLTQKDLAEGQLEDVSAETSA